MTPTQPLITLREVIESDLPIFFEHQSDPVAWRMAAFNPRDREKFMVHWKKLLANRAGVLRTILYGDVVAGTMMSFVMERKRQVGYWIGRELWGRGIATAALALFLDQYPKRPLYAHAARHNTASRRVLEKCGFQLIGDEPVEPLANGDPVTLCAYKLPRQKSQT
jgi:RimJ/RimL family protein N-acetyltransferase